MKLIPSLTADLDMASTSHNQIIRIPSVNGADFVSTRNLVRCEGVQKCTRIFLTNQAPIVSSYHIGVFRDLLEGLGFLQPHRSHLINPLHLRRFSNEGTLFMSDGSVVPVSRRKRKGLFERIRGPHRLGFQTSVTAPFNDNKA